MSTLSLSLWSPFQRPTSPDKFFCNSKTPEVLKRYVFSRNRFSGRIRPEPRGGYSPFPLITISLTRPAARLPLQKRSRLWCCSVVADSEGYREM